MTLWLRLFWALFRIQLHAMRHFPKFHVREERTYEGSTLIGATVGLLDPKTGEFHIYYEVTS